MKPVQDYYDEFSEGYDALRDQGYHALIDELEAEGICRHLTGRRWLDAGCGTGLILSRVLARTTIQGVGVDLSQGMLRHAAARQLTVIQGSITHLPFRDATFDGVFSCKTLPHIQAVEQAIRELFRVTQPGGRLALEFYNPWSLRSWRKQVSPPGRISPASSERDVFLRYDAFSQVRRWIAPYGQVVQSWGILVATPCAAAHRLGWMSRSLGAIERWCAKSPLRRWAGLLLVICEKRGLSHVRT